jgi:hypothetical protein
MDGGYNGPSFDEALNGIGDKDLVEMYTLVTGESNERVAAQLEAVPSGNWPEGLVRLFLSHSAAHKQFASEVADELAGMGIHGFVAHDAMEYTKPWQTQIEQALASMQLFVALVHPEFLESAWCQQEVGWAMGRGVPRYAIRFGADPTGFLGSDQWPSGFNQRAAKVAADIVGWVSTLPGLGEAVADGLVAALASASSYIEAGAIAGRIAALPELSEAQWRELSRTYASNDQVHGGALPSRALRPYFAAHKRAWPPAIA